MRHICLHRRSLSEYAYLGWTSGEGLIVQELRAKVSSAQASQAEMLQKAQEICSQAEERAAGAERRADRAEERASKAEAELKVPSQPMRVACMPAVVLAYTAVSSCAADQQGLWQGPSAGVICYNQPLTLALAHASSFSL